MEKTPTITSFVIRFVIEEPDLGSDPSNKTEGHPSSAPSAYRGTIRHVQSDLEVGFTHWSDVVEFVQRFVPLETLENQPDTPSKPV